MSSIQLADTYFNLNSANDGHASLLDAHHALMKHNFARIYPVGGEIKKIDIYPWPVQLANQAI